MIKPTTAAGKRQHEASWARDRDSVITDDEYALACGEHSPTGDCGACRAILAIEGEAREKGISDVIDRVESDIRSAEQDRIRNTHDSLVSILEDHNPQEHPTLDYIVCSCDDHDFLNQSFNDHLADRLLALGWTRLSMQDKGWREAAYFKGYNEGFAAAFTKERLARALARRADRTDAWVLLPKEMQDLWRKDAAAIIAALREEQ